MSSNRYQKNRHYLCLLSGCKNKLKKAIVNGSSKEQIDAICECILNVCNGNIKLEEENFKKLRPYNRTFKKLLGRKLRTSDKKKIILQHGGFLPILIPAIISAIGGIISASISRKN